MNRGTELSVLRYANTNNEPTPTSTKSKPLIIPTYQTLLQHQQPHLMNYYHNNNNNSSPSQIYHDQMISHPKYDDQQNNNTYQQMHSFSPPLSVASSSSGYSSSSLSSSPPSIKKLSRPSKKLHKINNSHFFTASSSPLSHINNTATTTCSIPQHKQTATWNFTWLVFMNEKWVPFDVTNQTRLEQTLTVGGTFVDIQDSHFPKVKRVRVFPKNNYLSYLGVKYRLSRIMQPDAYLDHVGVAEARKSC